MFNLFTKSRDVEKLYSSVAHLSVSVANLDREIRHYKELLVKTDAEFREYRRDILNVLERMRPVLDNVIAKADSDSKNYIEILKEVKELKAFRNSFPEHRDRVDFSDLFNT